MASAESPRLFYSADGFMTLIEYETEPEFRVTERKKFYQLRSRAGDLLPDGQSFVAFEPVATDQPLLRVAQNWLAEFTNE